MSPYTSTGGGDSWQVGDIRDLPHDTVPAKWLECLGQSLLRADYPDLFTAIGTKWGAADGDHFSLPNLRRKVLVGRDDTAPGAGCYDMRTVAGGCGEEKHTLTTCEMPCHDHPLSVSGPFAKTLGCSYVSLASGGNCYCVNHYISCSGCPSVPACGSGQSHNNLQPYRVVRRIIKVLP